MSEKKRTHLEIDHKTIIGKKFDMFADYSREKYWHPCKSESFLKYFGPTKIVPVTVEIVGILSREPRAYPSDTYYGFYECLGRFDGKDEPEDVKMIWPTDIQLHMCFPAGAFRSQEAGNGIAVTLKVTERIE